MTVQSINDRVNYVANGTTVVFSFDMKTLDSSWISAYEDGVVSTASITKTLNSDQELNPGGQITYASPPANNVVVTILRTATLDQLINYSSYSGFPAQVSENGLDKLTFIVQQLYFELGRSIRQNNIEDQRNMILPSIADRASRLLSFDANGDSVASSLLSIDVDLEAGIEILVLGTALVTFATPKVDANYVITFSSTFVETVRYSAKTVNGFTITSSNPASTATVDWMALS